MSYEPGIDLGFNKRQIVIMFLFGFLMFAIFLMNCLL